MSCIHPVTLSNKYITRLFKAGKFQTSSLTVPCGKCLNCRIQKESTLTFLANKELRYMYRNNQGSSFVTLTYDDNHIPINSKGKLTLRKDDLKKFMKRLRRRMEYYGDTTKFKYIYCGEYGDKFSRPHYHIVFLGLSDNQIKLYTRKVWRFGLCDVGPLSNGGLRYVCKYMTKQNPSKRVKRLYERNECERPFLYHSIGLAKQFIIDHVKQIAEDNFCFSLNGKLVPYPKNICRYVSLRTGIDYRPILRKFWNKTLFAEASRKHISIEDLQIEKSELQYMNNVACMRSKGIPVDDECCHLRKYIRPFHQVDRNISKLVDFALYRDVVPF